MVGIVDDVITNPVKYVKEILSNTFIDILDGDYVFIGIQPRGDDEFSKYVLNKFEGYEINFNFVRQSSFKQKEPNYIHTDEMMGDITVLLYLNSCYPKEAGTTIYGLGDEIKVIDYKFNRMCYFNSIERHSRNLKDNFGEGDESRLVQVIFLKENIMDSTELRKEIIDAGYKAVKQLIKVAKEEIIKPDPEDELAADKLKNAAASKKLSIFDAFEILKRIDNEKDNIKLESQGPNRTDTKQGFAERRSK